MRLKALKYLAPLILLAIALGVQAYGQQPQAQTGQPIFPTNAKYVQGVGPGYAPTVGNSLTLTIAPGTVLCNGAIQTYAGGTLSLTSNALNYVFLDTSTPCSPSSNTTAFPTGSAPIAIASTASTSISRPIQDVRTWFVSGPIAGMNWPSSAGIATFNGSTWGSSLATSGTGSTLCLTTACIIDLSNATNLPYSALTGTVPTWNQSTTGNAATASATPYSGLTGMVPTWNQSTTGNADTATALASSPTTCSGQQFDQGIAANGNATCAGPAAATFEHLTNTSLTAGLTKYFSAFFAGNTTSAADLPAPLSGSITDMTCISSTAPGSGYSYTYELYYSDAAQSTATCTISNTSLNCHTSGLAITITKGTVAATQVVTSASAATTAANACIYTVAGPH